MVCRSTLITKKLFHVFSSFSHINGLNTVVEGLGAGRRQDCGKLGFSCIKTLILNFCNISCLSANLYKILTDKYNMPEGYVFII